jgi:flagellar motor switch protein FliG
MAKQKKGQAQGNPGEGGGGGRKGGIKQELTGRQKAAIFLVTLGSEISCGNFQAPPGRGN